MVVVAEVTYLITIYAKNEQENISKADANLFAKLIMEIKNNLKEEGCIIFNYIFYNKL